jgi:hypothetical protein
VIARHRLIVVVCAVVAIALPTACGNGGGPAPTSPVSATPPASMTTASSAKLSDGVPSVRVPLDIKAFVAEPCKGITELQKRALSEKGVVVRPGARDDRESVPTCFFGDIEFRQTGGIYVALSYREDAGISAVYDKHAKGFLPGYWAPGEIAGYPVVYYSTSMSPTNCDIAIATSDTSYAGIRLHRLDSLEPWETGSCAVLRPIAEAVLDTIRNQ